MEYNDIKLEKRDKVATITLNRPQYGNAWSKDTPAELTDAIATCAEDNEVGVIVITGSGKNFCAGGDFNRFKHLIESKTYIQIPNVVRAGRMAMSIKNCPKPTIAMVNGVAAGAGCSMALACDFRIMTPKSKMVMAFVNVGLSGDTCGLYLLQKLVGTAKTTELMMTGKLLDGKTAESYGLVSTLADEGALESTTYAFAEKLAKGASFAMAKQKELINRFFYADAEEYIQLEAQFMRESSLTADFEEAVYAFLDKRKPTFTGK